mmetsp:Transcript_4033/g.8616  ORF Transcript_4033/g.8616 Transcript_4033/m.8616 type:complete len:242 (-) Transcript_4033:104-829(-)
MFCFGEEVRELATLLSKTCWLHPALQYWLAKGKVMPPNIFRSEGVHTRETERRRVLCDKEGHGKPVQAFSQAATCWQQRWQVQGAKDPKLGYRRSKVRKLSKEGLGCLLAWVIILPLFDFQFELATTAVSVCWRRVEGKADAFCNSKKQLHRKVRQPQFMVLFPCDCQWSAKPICCVEAEAQHQLLQLRAAPEASIRPLSETLWPRDINLFCILAHEHQDFVYGLEGKLSLASIGRLLLHG